jgi:hypothetical protein
MDMLLGLRVEVIRERFVAADGDSRTEWVR